MIDEIRLSFQRISAPSFSSDPDLRRKADGTYVDPQLEDHWQTFQEGWEAAINYIKCPDNESFSDLLTDGGYDPRN